MNEPVRLAQYRPAPAPEPQVGGIEAAVCAWCVWQRGSDECTHPLTLWRTSSFNNHEGQCGHMRPTTWTRLLRFFFRIRLPVWRKS